MDNLSGILDIKMFNHVAILYVIKQIYLFDCVIVLLSLKEPQGTMNANTEDGDGDANDASTQLVNDAYVQYHKE